MCYIGPTTAAIITTLMWRREKSVKLFWLMLMFYGGALFGIIDHWWNGELFLVSKHWLKDALLGVVIVGGIILAWAGILARARRNPEMFTFPPSMS